jgi:hypothetical protein
LNTTKYFVESGPSSPKQTALAPEHRVAARLHAANPVDLRPWNLPIRSIQECVKAVRLKDQSLSRQGQSATCGVSSDESVRERGPDDLLAGFERDGFDPDAHRSSIDAVQRQVRTL